MLTSCYLCVGNSHSLNFSGARLLAIVLPKVCLELNQTLALSLHSKSKKIANGHLGQDETPQRDMEHHSTRRDGGGGKGSCSMNGLCRIALFKGLQIYLRNDFVVYKMYENVTI